MRTNFRIARGAALGLAIALAVAGCASSPTQLSADIAQRIESAQSRSDHESIADYFAQEVTKAKRMANEHQRMARAYQARLDRGAGSMVAHCNSLVRSFEAAAADYERMATAHRQMAAEARP